MGLAGKLMGLVLTLVVLFLVAVYIGIFGPLPSHTELSHINNDVASEVYSRDGVLMGKYYLQNRMSVENKLISPHAINALVATEDSRFFEHNGYDPVSLARVLFRTVILGDKRQGGGSTIGQQLSKNLYPRQSYGVLSMAVNKSKEIFIAARLEKVYTKEEILILYLNTVPFGEDVYGIEAAAQRFFSKPSAELEEKEAAVLIGMLAANTAYNPRLHPERSKTRRNVVLGRMAEQGFVSHEIADSLMATAMELKYRRIGHNNGLAPYFRSMLKKDVQQVLEEKYGQHYKLYTDGLKVYTSIDAGMQRYAEEAVQEHMAVLQKQFKDHWKDRQPWDKSPEVYERELRKSEPYKAGKAQGWSDQEIKEAMMQLKKMTVFAYPKEKEVHLSSLDSIAHYLKILNTGFMVMDPRTGAVLSWIGGVSHKYFQYDHVTARRQVGSTFKPIVYAAALQEGMQPSDYISNERRVYQEYDNWSPGNANGMYNGYYSLKGGLAYSVNTITAAIMAKVGVDNVLNLAEEMGIESRLPAVPSISLGTGEISLKEMLTAYACFANDGKSVEPYGLLRIEDAQGKVIYQREEDIRLRVFDSETAQLMNQMLCNVVDKGTGRTLRSVYGLKGQIAGKTGTTQNNADGWFIAYNSHLVAGAWVGAESPQVHFRTTTLGQGAHTALPIYGRFMQKLQADPHYDSYTKASFKALSLEHKEMMAAADFVEKNPDKKMFGILKSKEEKTFELRFGKKDSAQALETKPEDKKERRRLFRRKTK